MYLNDKRFTIRTKEKKDGVDWIVDLKLTKKWKGKWEKKRWVLPSCGFEIIKKWKGKQEKKRVLPSCAFEK